MKVAVVGGGVIGVFCAYHLQKLGVDTVVLERDQVGSGCSRGNMGWVCPSIATPLPAPGLTLQSLSWLTRVESPLFIEPMSMPRLARWLWAFRRHCNPVSYEHGISALGSLTANTPALYDELERDGVSFEQSKAGLLLVYSDSEKLEAARRDLLKMERFGVGPVETLDPAMLQAREPGLSTGLVGGLLVTSDRHVRPETVTAGVAASISLGGGRLVEDQAVEGFRTESGRARAVFGADLEEEADVFILAGGAETGALTSRLGVRLPMQAGKGYSITIAGPRVSVRQATYFDGVKVGLTPFEGSLRVAGTMELSGINRTLDRRRLRNLENAVARFIPGALDGETRTDWVGMRPLTPDGLPAIGRLPGWENVYVATGHQMLGVTLAPATGLALAHLIVEGTSPIDLAPFDPGRF